MLACVGENEFGVLFRGNDIARAIQALERALSSLQSSPVAGDRGYAARVSRGGPSPPADGPNLPLTYHPVPDIA